MLVDLEVMHTSIAANSIWWIWKSHDDFIALLAGLVLFFLALFVNLDFAGIAVR